MDIAYRMLEPTSRHHNSTAHSPPPSAVIKEPTFVVPSRRRDAGYDQTPFAQSRVGDEATVQQTKPFYYNPMLVTIMIAGCVLLVSISLGYTMYLRRRRRSHDNYEDISENGKSNSGQSGKTGSSKPLDPQIYSYVCPRRSIDFVVPSIPTALSSLPSPGDKAVHSALPSPDAQAYPIDGGASLLGGLNPELYKVVPEEPPEETDFPDEHLGRLWFALEYEASSERLMVRLIKIKNLPSRTYGSVNCCDPYVRIYLIPDERRYLQSKLKKKTCNPRFEETFIFQVPGKTGEERTLKFTVFDSDRGKHHKVIGHVIYPLKDFISQTTVDNLVMWKDLEKDGQLQVPTDMGELLVSLCYNQNLERLTVTVFNARGLRLPNGITSLDSYVKISFLRENKTIKSKKTMIAKKTKEPKYNESFNFRLPQNVINTTSVILQVTMVGAGQKDKCLGRVVLGAFMFARGKGLEHWNEAMSAGYRQIRYWHKMT